MGAAGLAGFGVAFAGELEGADGFFLILGFFVGVANLDSGLGGGFLDDLTLVVEDDGFLLFAEAAVAFGDGEIVCREAVNLPVAGDGFFPVGEFFVTSCDRP